MVVRIWSKVSVKRRRHSCWHHNVVPSLIFHFIWQTFLITVLPLLRWKMGNATPLRHLSLAWIRQTTAHLDMGCQRAVMNALKDISIFRARIVPRLGYLILVLDPGHQVGILLDALFTFTMESGTSSTILEVDSQAYNQIGFLCAHLMVTVMICSPPSRWTINSIKGLWMNEYGWTLVVWCVNREGGVHRWKRNEKMLLEEG